MIHTKVHFEMTVRTDHGEWNEKLEGHLFENAPENDKEAIDQARKTIAYFNRTIKPDEQPRRIACVQRVETKVIDILDYIDLL